MNAEITIKYKLTGVRVNDTRDIFVTPEGDVYRLVDDEDGIDLIRDLHLEAGIKLSVEPEGGK